MCVCVYVYVYVYVCMCSYVYACMCVGVYRERLFSRLKSRGFYHASRRGQAPYLWVVVGLLSSWVSGKTSGLQKLGLGSNPGDNTPCFCCGVLVGVSNFFTKG